MKRLKQALVAGPILAWLVCAGGSALQASGITTDGDDGEIKMQVSTFSLDSLDALEVKSVKEDGVDPVKTKADVATYRGRRAVRVVNDGGRTATGAPARSSKHRNSKMARLKPTLLACRARERRQLRGGLSASHFTSWIMAPGLNPSICA